MGSYAYELDMTLNTTVTALRKNDLCHILAQELEYVSYTNKCGQMNILKQYPWKCCDAKSIHIHKQPISY